MCSLDRKIAQRSGFYFSLLVFILFPGCQKGTGTLERTMAVINGQKFELITTYALFENFLTRQGNSDDAVNSNQYIYEPIQHEILQNAEAPFMFETIHIPYRQDSLLKQEIALLRSADITSIIKKALGTITSKLPGPDTKIIIMPANSVMHEIFLKYGVCINAVTLGSGKIIIQIDPTFPQWQETLPYIVAHEYHHSTWISRNWKSADFSVLEYLVFEGRADAFATTLYSHIKNPWTMMVPKAQEQAVWNIIKPELLQHGHERINRVMAGDKDIPMGSGYTLGFHIVQSFKQHHTEYTDKEIIDLEPEKLLALSSYTGLFEQKISR